jgi:hypothetical protein
VPPKELFVRKTFFLLKLVKLGYNIVINVILSKHQRMTKKWEMRNLTHMPNKDHGLEIGLFTTERQSLNSYVLSLQW